MDANEVYKYIKELKLSREKKAAELVELDKELAKLARLTDKDQTYRGMDKTEIYRSTYPRTVW